MQIPKQYLYIAAGVIVLVLIVGLAVATGIVSTRLNRTARDKREMERKISDLESALESALDDEQLRLVEKELEAVKEELQQCYSSSNSTTEDDNTDEGGTNLGLVVGLPVVFIVLGGAGYAYYYYVENIKGQGSFLPDKPKRKKNPDPVYRSLFEITKPVVPEGQKKTTKSSWRQRFTRRSRRGARQSKPGGS